jgi:hypothetical protein
MNKQSILDLYNSSPPPTPTDPVQQLAQNQNGIQTWNQHGM